MDYQLRGKLAFVTAGAHGIGEAIANPDKVSAIYARNPYLYSLMSQTQPIDNLAPLAKAGVPILHDCGSLDPCPWCTRFRAGRDF
jgi:hypothetical protein